MSKSYKPYVFLLLLFVCFFTVCSQEVNNSGSTNNNAYPIPEKINDCWETASLPSVGLDENKLIEMANKNILMF